MWPSAKQSHRENVSSTKRTGTSAKLVDYRNVLRWVWIEMQFRVSEVLEIHALDNQFQQYHQCNNLCTKPHIDRNFYFLRRLTISLSIINLRHIFHFHICLMYRINILIRNHHHHHHLRIWWKMLEALLVGIFVLDVN